MTNLTDYKGLIVGIILAAAVMAFFFAFLMGETPTRYYRVTDYAGDTRMIEAIRALADDGCMRFDLPDGKTPWPAWQVSNARHRLRAQDLRPGVQPGRSSLREARGRERQSRGLTASNPNLVEVETPMNAMTLILCGLIGYITSQAMDLAPRKWAIPIAIAGASLALLVGYLMTKVGQ